MILILKVNPGETLYVNCPALNHSCNFSFLQVASDISFTEAHPQASDRKIDSSRKLERSTVCSLKTNPFLDNTLEDSFDRMCL